MSTEIVVCEDNESARAFLCASLKSFGYDHVKPVSTGMACLSAVSHVTKCVLLDIGLPDVSGLEVLATLRKKHPDLPVIVVTGSSDLNDAVRAMRAGAANYIRKPASLQALRIAVDEVLGEKVVTPSVPHLQSTAPAMKAVLSMVETCAPYASPILLLGDTGTGKEVLARTIHELSGRRGPFVGINCPALPTTLVESELFGYEKGAFTGADQARKGKLLEADQGTLFLDEIADLSSQAQAKILRVLQEREVEPLGSNRKYPFHARVIAATSRDINALMSNGMFRSDLFYRLNEIEIAIPTLAQRSSDIPALIAYFSEEFAKENRVSSKAFTKDAIDRLCASAWPGNIRQLRSVVRRALILSRDVQVTEKELPTDIHQAEQRDDTSLAKSSKLTVLKALLKHNNNVARAAEELNISRSTIYRQMKRWNEAG